MSCLQLLVVRFLLHLGTDGSGNGIGGIPDVDNVAEANRLQQKGNAAANKISVKGRRHLWGGSFLLKRIAARKEHGAETLLVQS